MWMFRRQEKTEHERWATVLEMVVKEVVSQRI